MTPPDLPTHQTTGGQVVRRWGGVGLIIGVAVLLRLPLFFTTPILSDDIYRYLWDGRVQQAGINPYVYSPDAPELEKLRDNTNALINHRNVRTVYPPLTEWVYRLGAVLYPSIFMQKGLFVLFDMGTVFLLVAFLKLKGRSVMRAALYAWNPLVVIEFSASGHNDSLMIFLLVLGCYLFERGKESSSAIGFAGATLAKWIPIYMIPWFLIRRDWRSLILYGTVVVLACLPFAAGVYGMIHALKPVETGLQTYARDWVFNPSIYGLVGLVLPNPLHRRIFLGGVLGVFSFWWASKNVENPTRYIFGCLYALLLTGPVVHPWYVTWIVPFLCFYPLWSGLAWSLVVFLTYAVLIRYRSEGIWELPLWVSALEYSVVYGLIGKELIQWRSRSSYRS